MMNEVGKKTVAEVANRLALMAAELKCGKFMSIADVASVIDKRVRHLRDALDYAATAAQPAEEREIISRAEAVRILMQLQAIEARCGHANINAALEMAISCIVKKHRNVCRNKAKRRAARMAAGAAKEGK